ncbi:MAG TPA: diguanylate cyclase, partial [Solirubrobacteraceae bacterium]|nr:diguanylate cyclase [Solirubrobacteraceae bacterium]
ALAAEAAAAFGADAVVCRITPSAGHPGGPPAAVKGGTQVQILDERPSGLAHVVATGRTLAVPDARSSDVVRSDIASEVDLGGALFVPVAWHGEVRHVLLVSVYGEPRDWTAADVELAEGLADQAALGLALQESEDRRVTQSERDHALARAARALNASLDRTDILETLAREANLAVGGSVAEVYLVDERGCGVATAGHQTANGWRGHRLAPGEGVAGEVLAAGEPVVFNAIEEDLRGTGGPTAPDLHSEVGVPMRWDGRLRGALCVRFRDLQHVREDQLEVLEAVAELAVSACRNADAYENARTAASTDALTGLLNHGAFQLRVREEIARAARDSQPLSCVLVDLDDFKRVNDELGHLAGDAILRTVAGALRAALRPYDSAARYGGDEFVLLLPGTDEHAARAVVDRVREHLREAGENGTGPTARCSVGIAGWSPGMDADDLLEQADRGLLLAKRTGKGRVAVAALDTDDELERLAASDGPVAVQALVAAIETRDHYFHGHSEDVVHLATNVAMLLGQPAGFVEHVRHAALLHDVGKLAVPSAILAKDGELDEHEWSVMAEHPVLGEQILRRLPQLAALAPIVRHEHEHWDGSGYPDGLAGARIPLGSRIILACDAYAAMTTPRPYRPARSPEEAVAELRRLAGSQFDPDVVDALLDVLGVA